MTESTPACLTCHQRQGHIRGLCDPCFVKHAKAIKSAKTTWAELEQRGLAQPAGSSLQELVPGPESKK